MARVNTVEKSLKSPGNCGRCNKTIKKGEPYRWTKPRYGGKKIRCMDAACRFRSSDLTSSDKLSRAHAAGEAVEDALEAFRESREIEDLNSALSDAAEQLREVAGEYRESADNMESGMNGNRMPMCDELEEKAQNLEDKADEMDGGSLPELEEEDPADLTDDQIKELLESEHGDLDSYATELLTESDEHFTDKPKEGQEELVTNKIDELVEGKRTELKEEYEQAVENWVEEVCGEVEEFTNIEVG